MGPTAFRLIRFFVLMFLLCNLIYVSNANAATIYAASCSQSDVQAAIDSASNGDNVLVPAGECTWTTVGDTWSVEVSGKSITLRGAGIDQTIINDGTGKYGEREPLAIRVANGIRVTGFTFKGMESGDVAIVAGGANNFRIDHCEFNGGSAGRGVKASQSYGVIDHCTFINCVQGVSVFGAGDTEWTTAQNLGSADATYVEDCNFAYTAVLDGALDAYKGARYVFRYNTVTNTYMGHHGLDSGGEGYRSPHSYEIYENIFTTSISIARAMYFRGGTGVVFNNQINHTGSGFYGGKIDVTSYRSCKSYDHWGTCDGDNEIDGNTEPKETYYGWPCQDQIGRTTNQASSPLYEWGNTADGADVDIAVSDYCAGSTPNVNTHIQKDRDFFNDTQRPGYTPYEYPHPLTKTTTTELSAPSNLRIVEASQ